MTPVTVNGRLVYAVCLETGRGLRLRVDADEGELLGLFEGHMAEVGVRGGPPAAYHVLYVVPVDPCWTWVELSVTPVGPCSSPSSARAAEFYRRPGGSRGGSGKT